MCFNKYNDNCTKAVILEINCETDFVARDKSFLDFANFTSNEFLKIDTPSINSIIKKERDNEIESMRKQLVMKLGENITIRRAQLIETHLNSLVIYIMEKLQFYLMRPH